MREAPDVDQHLLLATVRYQWSDAVEHLEHLPLGFGAHHWAAHTESGPVLFVTLDHFRGRHDARSLEAAYASAAELARRGLDFVVDSRPSADGSFTVPFADGALSATSWIDGERPPDALGAVELVRRLHLAPVPDDTPSWAPLVPVTFARDLEVRLSTPWRSGPHARSAQQSLLRRLDAISTWTDAYHRLAVAARRRPWVATHGEPHRLNLLATAAGLRIVDWESLERAPAERDLRILGVPDAAPDMVELFDLEWRLDEVAQYASWFEGAHGDGDDDRTALAGLVEELTRP